jgi:ankyrin repeat protein
VVLIKHHADVNYVNKAGRTPLHWAARNGQVSTCAWLASRGADVNATAKDAVNTFHWAVWGRHIPTCEWALAAGVDSMAVNRWGCSAIHWAGAAGDVALCKWLSDIPGMDFSQRNNQGHDGLKKAAWNGHWELCEWLLEGATLITLP